MGEQGIGAGAGVTHREVRAPGKGEDAKNLSQTTAARAGGIEADGQCQTLTARAGHVSPLLSLSGDSAGVMLSHGPPSPLLRARDSAARREVWSL